MDNRILSVEVRDQVLTPASVELHVAVRTESRTPETALHGRLMGPRCLFSSTVEVAYPLRQLPTTGKPDADELVARVVIPEASFWDPQSPFLYGGPVELWEADRRCDLVQVWRGLRVLRQGPRGFSLNGRPFVVRAKELTSPCSGDEAMRLRQSGYNLLIVPLREALIPVWDTGDRVGFLVIGQVIPGEPDCVDRIRRLQHHPSCAGWLADKSDLPVEGILPPDALGLLGVID
jgi:hypothetical protein